MAQMRSGEFPMIYAIFTATLLSNIDRYSATVDHRPGSGGFPSKPRIDFHELQEVLVRVERRI